MFLGIHNFITILRCTSFSYLSPVRAFFFAIRGLRETRDDSGTQCVHQWRSRVSAREASRIQAKKQAARTTPSVVISNRPRRLKTPTFSRKAATMGEFELTGLEMGRLEQRLVRDRGQCMRWSTSRKFRRYPLFWKKKTKKRTITGHL